MLIYALLLNVVASSSSCVVAYSAIKAVDDSWWLYPSPSISVTCHLSQLRPISCICSLSYPVQKSNSLPFSCPLPFHRGLNSVALYAILLSENMANKLPLPASNSIDQLSLCSHSVQYLFVCDHLLQQHPQHSSIEPHSRTCKFVLHHLANIPGLATIS